MAEGWRPEPPPADPAASRWTYTPAETRDVVLSVLVTAPLPDEHPLPSVDPPHPGLETVLAWVAPWWASRRAAARVARYQRAVWAGVAAAADARSRATDLPSRHGAAWRASRFWQ